MLNKTKILLAITLICSLFVPFLIVLFNAKILIMDENFYHSEFKKYGVYSSLKNNDADKLNRDVLYYINSEKNSLPDFFIQREKQHLEDVRYVFQKAQLLLVLSYEILLIYFIAVLLFIRDLKKTAFYSALTVSLGCAVALFMLLIILVPIKFNFGLSFDKFHSAFFNQGTYTFNPAVEKIVVLYPEGLFYDAGIRIVLNSILTAFILLVLGFVIMWFTRRTETKVINNQD